MFKVHANSCISVLIALGVLCFTQQLGAFHIIGGEMIYECIGIGNDSTERTFRFQMRVYRDCAGDGADFDDPAVIGVYREIGGVYTFVRTFGTSPLSIRRVPPPDDPCLVVPDGVCVQEAIYEFTIPDLPLIDGSYHVFWRRCCRNVSINNIVDARNTGATYTVEITAEAQRLFNDSPIFNSFPPTVICVNQPLFFDHSASDGADDQLVYEFCAPLQGGGPAGGTPGSGNPGQCNGIMPNPANCPPPDPPVDFVGPTFTPNFPLAGNPRVQIDPVTGVITGIPQIQGQFVVGVCVKEYRDGELLSTLRRDFQFNVSVCEIAVFADVEADTTLGSGDYVINSCGENTVNFINNSTSVDNIQSYEWKFDINGDITTITDRNATVTFPGIGTYTGRMVLNRGLACADSADITVNVYPDIEADFSFEYDTCFGAPVVFTDESFTGSGQFTAWDWSFGDGNTSKVTDPEHLYEIPGNHEISLVVTDVNKCRDEEIQTIQYFPAPPVVIVEPSTFIGCEPAQIRFNNLSIPIDSTYDIVWSFSDGGSSTDINPTYVFDEPGTYSIDIEITSPIGCFNSGEFPAFIRVRPSPQAGFAYTPQVLTQYESEVRFFDESVDAATLQWTFGRESLSFLRNPTYTFRDTGIQQVEQVVYHENGCTDTARAELDVVPTVKYFLPNAFTPNNDGRNDGYRGVGVLDEIRDFQLTIWSRWGELLFETNDPLEEWNGRKNNTGEDMPGGVYICRVRYTTPRNQDVVLEEFATLIR